MKKFRNKIIRKVYMKINKTYNNLQTNIILNKVSWVLILTINKY